MPQQFEDNPPKPAFQVGDGVVVQGKHGRPARVGQIVVDSHPDDTYIVYAHHPGDETHPVVREAPIDCAAPIPSDVAPELITPPR